MFMCACRGVSCKFNVTRSNVFGDTNMEVVNKRDQLEALAWNKQIAPRSDQIMHCEIYLSERREFIDVATDFVHTAWFGKKKRNWKSAHMLWNW